MGFLLSLAVPAILLLGVNLSFSVVVHGSTYRIKNVADGKYLSAFSHTYLPKTGLIPGKVYEEEWRDQTNQLWDAIAMRTGSESLEAEFWLFPKKAILNELTVVPVPQKSNNSSHPSYRFRTQLTPVQAQLQISKNLVNLRPTVTDKSTYLIRSVLLDQCFEGHGQHAATFVTCNASKLEQQWEFDIIYDD